MCKFHFRFTISSFMTQIPRFSLLYDLEDDHQKITMLCVDNLLKMFCFSKKSQISTTNERKTNSDRFQ